MVVVVVVVGHCRHERNGDQHAVPRSAADIDVDAYADADAVAAAHVRLRRRRHHRRSQMDSCSFHCECGLLHTSFMAVVRL